MLKIARETRETALLSDSDKINVDRVIILSIFDKSISVTFVINTFLCD